tara:strand:+ start:92 stop:322 length:231 start_codon:yes stop_codon:yes gene_type:complete
MDYDDIERQLNVVRISIKSFQENGYTGEGYSVEDSVLKELFDEEQMLIEARWEYLAEIDEARSIFDGRSEEDLMMD